MTCKPLTSEHSWQMRVLVGPAHWGGSSHEAQLIAVAHALVRRGHEVHYVTDRPAPSAPAGMVIHVAEVAWPAQLDVQLGLCWLTEEPAHVDARNVEPRKSEHHLCYQRLLLLEGALERSGDFEAVAHLAFLERVLHDALL